MQRTYRTSATEGNSPDVERNFGISQTVPDQSYSVREILEKFASGTLPNIIMEQPFTEDLPDLRGLDISEMHNLKEANKSDIKEKEETLKRQKKELSKVSEKPKETENPKTIDDAGKL